VVLLFGSIDTLKWMYDPTNSVLRVGRSETSFASDGRDAAGEMRRRHDSEFANPMRFVFAVVAVAECGGLQADQEPRPARSRF